MKKVLGKLLFCLSLFSGSTFPRIPFFHPEQSEKTLNELWSSLSDLNCPSLEDYQKIETYLREGRNYLLSYNCARRDRILNFRLLGPNGEMPLFERRQLGTPEEKSNRCILIYASYNGIYPEKGVTLLHELEQCGYQGDVLLQIGGFPNTENGGLTLCHVPYAFKAAFLDHARLLGYEEVLWIDTSFHPLTSFELFFSEIRKRGYFLCSAGSLEENRHCASEIANEALQISFDVYPKIPHIWAGFIGLNMKHPAALQLLENWISDLRKVAPCMSDFQEELSLSVVAWRLKIKPFFQVGTILCLESEKDYLPAQKPTIQAYMDSRR